MPRVDTELPFGCTPTVTIWFRNWAVH